MKIRIAGLGLLLLFLSCATGSQGPESGRIEYAIAIHGGAGVPRDSLGDDLQHAYLASLEEALRVGLGILEQGGGSLDAVEQTLRYLEDDPLFNAGRGAVFNRDGVNELDASIMDGSTLGCGAVTGARSVRNPISLARLVMERTDHVLLAGEGAERFAAEMGVERVAPRYFFTERRWERMQQALEDDAGGGTVGAVALDREGNLAAGTSTGGLTAKMAGRVGDTPIIGAGTYADNRSCAISCTGRGEEFIRRGVALQVAALVRNGGMELVQAAQRMVDDELQPGDGGLIALGPTGEIAMVFNTPGMFRGAADSRGLFEVHIWDESVPASGRQEGE
jgi:beta-aspartyl-peptidase (threonine type)